MDAINRNWQVLRALVLARPFILFILSLFYVLAGFLALALEPDRKVSVILIMCAIPACGVFAIATERVIQYTTAASSLGLPRHRESMRIGQLWLMGIFVGIPASIAAVCGGDPTYIMLLLVPAAIGVLLAIYSRWVFLLWVTLAVTTRFTYSVGTWMPGLGNPWIRMILAGLSVAALYWWLGLANRIAQRSLNASLVIADSRHESSTASIGKALGADPKQYDLYERAYDRGITAIVAGITDRSITRRVLQMGLAMPGRTNWRFAGVMVAISLAALLFLHRSNPHSVQPTGYLGITLLAAASLFGQLNAVMQACKARANEAALLVLTPRWPTQDKVKSLFVSRDDKQAYFHFEQASRHKNPWSYTNLAEMTFLGRGVPADATRSIGWLEKGAANGCTLRLIQEAAAYHSGAYNVRPDTDKTVALLRKASALGDSQATLILAELYLVGDGVPQSSAKAFDTLKKALSDQGYADATNRLGELSADDQILHYTFDHFLGGARQVPADFGNVFPQEPARAIRFWELADQQGSCQSLVNLSSFYDRGVGVGTDHKRAADYVDQAVHCDPTNSFYLWKLAMRYFDANGRAHDCEAAEKYFVESLDHGYADAAVDLGYIFDKGCGTIPRDDARAFQIYLLGAKLGVALCQNNVGAMIKHGRGVKEADPARGYGWIKLAALKGDELANKNLQDKLFTAEVRAAGLAHLADIQARLLVNSADPQVILNDPWF